MKVFLRMLTCLLTICICFAGMAIPGAAEEEGGLFSFYFSEGFDTVDDGLMPDSTIIDSYNQKNNTMGVVPVPSKNDKSAQFLIKSKDDCHLTKIFKNAITGKFVAQFVVRVDNNDGCLKNFIIYTSSGVEIKLFSIERSGALSCGGYSTGIVLPEGKFSTISAVVDADKHKYDLYVNYRLRATNIELGESFSDCERFRVHVTSVSEGCNTRLYVSDVKFYESDHLMSPDEIAHTDWRVISTSKALNSSSLDLLMSNKVAFYKDASKAFKDGKSTYIDENNKDVVPYSYMDELYVPLRFGIEGFGGTVKWNGDTNTTNVIIAGKEAVINLGSKTITVTGADNIELANPPQVTNGRLFIPVSALANLAEKNLFEDEVGLAILSNAKLSYSWYDDETVMKSIIGAMVFERPTGEEILAAVEAKHPNYGHPRIFGTQDDFERIKSEIATSAIKKDWFEKIKSQTESLMQREPVVYGTTDGVRMRAQSGQVAAIVGQCSFMYKITGETRYAERAWKELEALFSFPDWHPSHYLDTGQFMNGFAMGYDWLYDWMTEEQRSRALENLVKNGLKETLNCYNGIGYNSGWMWRDADNWNLEINSGAIMASLAVCDEERDVSLQVLTNAMKSIELGTMSYAPDGPWYEGVSYWQLSTETLVEAMCALEASTGSTYGILNSPGVKETGWYPYALMGVATFNFSDAGERTNAEEDTKELFYFADKIGDPTLSQLRYSRMLQDNVQPNFREMFYCKGDPVAADVDMKLDYYYRMTEAVSMRNNWDTESMLFAAMHSGENAATHGHLDIGQFVIDSFGDRFASDLGNENYNLPGAYFSKYRNRAEGHNTLLFNPSDEPFDQNYDAYCRFERFESNDVSAIAVTDMTEAYPNDVTSAVRGMKMTSGRTQIVIQDEVRSDKENEVYWAMHTKADIDISADGKTAVLNIGGNKMEAKILSKQGTFTVMPAQALPTSPTIAGQNANKGYQKLAIHFDKVKDFDICVCFTPLVYKPKGGVTYPEVTSIDSWKLDDVEKVHIGELPRLTDIKLDGVSLAGFDTKKSFYSVALKKADSPCPVITAEGNGTVEVVHPDEWPGSVEIHVSNEYYDNVYGLKFNVPPESLADKGFVELDVANVDAGSVPQAQNPPINTLDNDFETRYSCDMPAWICYDFGSVHNIYYVSLAFYSGSIRKCQFSIEISEDGQHFTKVWEGLSGGETDELEDFYIGGNKARYVRITGTGLLNNGEDKVKSGWFSPSEFKAYTVAE